MTVDENKAGNFPRFREEGQAGDIDTELDKLLGRIGPGNPTQDKIRVAIIDTWPMDDPANPLGLIQQFVNNNANADPLLQQFAAGGIVPANQIRDLVTGGDMSLMQSLRVGCNRVAEDPSVVADHGLFIAGIIHQIAGDAADIWVYRAFDDYGVSTYERITEAVQRALEDAGGNLLVINCSFGLGPELLMLGPFMEVRGSDGLPQSGALDAYRRGGEWLRFGGQKLQDGSPPGAGGKRKRSTGGRGRERGARDHEALTAVRTLFRLTNMPNVLPVAAAGNDSCRCDGHAGCGHGRIGGPRVPAAIEKLLGVSAMVLTDNGDWEAATYTNDDDIERERDDAVSAYGGDCTERTAPDDLPGRSLRGLYGPYITANLEKNPELPGQAPDNRFGIAQWSGTSFATPVVAGIAVRLWQLRGQATAGQIMNALVGDPATPGTINDFDDVADVKRRIELRQR